jgi:hypothetical protein
VSDLEARFIHLAVSSEIGRGDGTWDKTRDPAVWTLAHRGYSGGGRLDVWVHESERDALRAGAELAMAAGMDEDRVAVRFFNAGQYQKVFDRYLAARPDHVLSVQVAFLQTGTMAAEQAERELLDRIRRERA